MPGPESADEVCPVCRWPVLGTAVCKRCRSGRIGRSGRGPATAADHLRRETPLIERQRAYDLRAAARVLAAAPDDRLLPELLGEAVRGGRLPAGEIKRAMARVTARKPLPVSRAGLVFALTRLVAGKTGAIAFVEIGPDAVSMQLLAVDARGVPVQGDGEIVRWDAILPSLPRQLGPLYLRLAGGIGISSAEREDPDPAALDAAIRDERGAFPPVLARFAAAAKAAAAGRSGCAPGEPDAMSRPPDVVLVHRTRNWPLLDAAAVQARAVLRPVTEITVAPESKDLASVVACAATQAPLRYGYDLIGVDVEPETGIVRPRSCELFPAGAVVPLPDTTVTVSPVTGHTAEQVALPIVARRGPVTNHHDVGALEKCWPLVEMAAFDATAGGPFRVHAGLAGPGRAEPLSPSAPVPAKALAADWPRLVAELPDRLPSAGVSSPVGLDLVILVELGAAMGRSAVVESRIRLAGELVREFHSVSAARIGVLGYREHTAHYRLSLNGVRHDEDRAFVVGTTGGPGSPAEAQATLQRAGRWRAVRLEDDHAAPVEEALLIVAAGRWRWRTGARHVLLVIGHRPPHPQEAGPGPDVMLPCPFGHSWRDALARLRNGHSAECFAVLDHAPQPGYAEQTWAELTASGQWWPHGISAHELARVFGLTPPPSAQLRLAMLVGVASPAVTKRKVAR